MSQPTANERRSEPRQAAAFAFWVRGRGDADALGAWMHDIAPSGAAFLIDARAEWPPGELLSFEPMAGAEQAINETMPTLPTAGRVLRVEPPVGCLRRIAVRLESIEPAVGRSAPRTCDETSARPPVLPGQSFPPFDGAATPPSRVRH